MAHKMKDRKKTKEQLVGELAELRQRVAELETAEVKREQRTGLPEESERRFQTLVSVSPVGIFRTDAKGNYIYVNERWCEIAGLTPEEASGEGWARSLHPEDREDTFAEWCWVVRESRPFELEYRFQRPDGVTTWVFGQAVTEKDDSDKVVGYVGTITDVTVRRRIEEVLVKSEAKFYSLVEQAGAGIVTLNVEGRLSFVNRAFFQMIGYPSAELLGQPFAQFIHPDDVERIQAQFQEDFQRLPKHHLEYRLLHKDGHVVHCYSNPAAILHQGQVVGTSAIIHDITERKRAEAELQAEYARLDAILRSVGDAILMTDQDMRVQYVNSAFTGLTGYTEEELLGEYAGSFGAGMGSEQSQQLIELALADGRTWQGEVIGQRKDGRRYDAALIVAPVRDAKDRLVGYVSSHRDISPSKNLERARSQFINNVSHQFRTPVTVLTLAVNLMQQAELAEKDQQHLQIIEDQVARLIHLIEDTLEITVMDSGNAITTWAPIILSIVVDSAITRHLMQSETSGLTLAAMPFPPDLPVVNGDQVRLTQALGEIVENAVTFTPSGGRVAVEVQSVETEDMRWVTITVRDTGPGIPPEEQEKVFNRFFRGSLAESGNIPGTGLGLSIVQEIVHAHGGRVTVESKEGVGSTFVIWLPVAG